MLLCRAQADGTHLALALSWLLGFSLAPWLCLAPWLLLCLAYIGVRQRVRQGTLARGGGVDLLALAGKLGHVNLSSSPQS
ncbi:hypothetical protein B0T24DRAFT_611783 [Lasiosphaeria ovina]|uniref:Uncharacterized protein n=1 Tax=Lasiosphaeria ovina TaxID=92902 RepID=A0AAE0KMJ1_9PEZI|nr:hypothetical protein B0T24DRAFT_611783 [Lasiosphaeria ovina]